MQDARKALVTIGATIHRRHGTPARYDHVPKLKTTDDATKTCMQGTSDNSKNYHSAPVVPAEKKAGGTTDYTTLVAHTEIA